MVAESAALSENQLLASSTTSSNERRLLESPDREFQLNQSNQWPRIPTYTVPSARTVSPWVRHAGTCVRPVGPCCRPVGPCGRPVGPGVPPVGSYVQTVRQTVRTMGPGSMPIQHTEVTNQVPAGRDQFSGKDKKTTKVSKNDAKHIFYHK